MSQKVSDQGAVLTDLPLGRSGGPDLPEVLIREARRRKRRRWALSLLVLVAAGVLTAGLLSAYGFPPPGSPGSTPSSLSPTAKTTTGPTTPTGEPATPSSSPEIRLLFSSASPLMGVVALAANGPGSGTSALYLTHNFVTYDRIALPVPPRTTHRIVTIVSDVTFPTPTMGWAVDVAPASGVYLFETTDGGHTWRYVKEVHAEANGAFGWVRFVSATVGWVAAGDIGVAGPSTVLHTEDGGHTWQPLPGEGNTGSARPYFVSSTVGFVHRDVGPGGSTRLLVTTDGGITWRPLVLPVKVAGTVLPGIPKMYGADGVLPLVVAPQPSELTAGERVRLALVFDTTRDGGRAWSAGPSVRATAVTGFSTVWSTAGWIADGPAVAVASNTDWWVLAAKATGKIAIRVTRDAGSTWTTEAGRGLPTIHVASDLDHQVNTPLVLQAITDKVAFLVVKTSPQGRSSYVTTDGGARWSLLTAATVQTLPTTRELLAPVVKVSPSKGLVGSETVRVSISGFGADSRYHVSECSSDVDVSEAGCGIGLTTQPTVATARSGRGSADFVVSSSAAPSSDTTSSKRRCTNRCVLVVSGGLGHGLALAPLTFRH